MWRMGRLCVAAVLMARGSERARYDRLRLGCSLAIHVGEHRDDDQQHHGHVVATDQRSHGTSDTLTEHRAELRDVGAVAHSLDARDERDDVAHNQSDDQRHAGTHQDAQEEDGVVGEGEAVEIDRAAGGAEGHRIGDRRIVDRGRAERKPVATSTITTMLKRQPRPSRCPDRVSPSHEKYSLFNPFRRMYAPKGDVH